MDVRRHLEPFGDVELRAVTDAIPILIASCDRDLRFRFVNKSYAASFGKTPSEVVGKHIWEVVGEAVYESFREHVREVLGGTPLEFEAEGSYAGQGKRFMHVACIPQRDESGEVDGFVAVMSDITTRVRTAAEILESRDTVEIVNSVGQIVAAELDLEKAVQKVTDAATKLTGAQFGAFFYNRIDDQGEKYMLYALSGVPREAFASFPMPRNTQLFGATFRAEGVVRLDDVTRDPRYGQNPPYQGKPPGHLPVTSYLAVPVVARSGEVLGGLFFGHAEPGRFTERHERLMIGLASQAANAIDNARLFEAERKARAEAEIAQERLAFLAEAGAVLASSLDYTTTLDAVARLAVRFLADYCVIDVLEEDGSTRRLAIHFDPVKDMLVQRLKELPPPSFHMERMERVIRSGEPDVMNDVDVSLATEIQRDPERHRILLALQPRAYMVVVLSTRGRALGTMTLVASESGRRYEQTDVALARELARRAAVAIENARLHAAETRARAEAEAANRAKDEFLSVVSHELRTPLNSTLGWVNVLRSDKDGVRKTRALDSIERSVRTQTRLIEDLLDVSRIASGQLRLDVRSLDLRALVDTVLEETRPQAEAKGIHLRAELDDLSSPTSGDHDRLAQVVSNLLNNALKFTPRGGRIDVRLANGRGDVQLIVRDDGSGIRKDFLPHVFEPFRQADSVASRRQGGLGLGLAITRHLVELHGGTILAESEGEGLGATFTVSLPRTGGGRRRGTKPLDESPERGI
jgi:PAS domain S-box-containing protein